MGQQSFECSVMIPQTKCGKISGHDYSAEPAGVKIVLGGFLAVGFPFMNKEEKKKLRRGKPMKWVKRARFAQRSQLLSPCPAGLPQALRSLKNLCKTRNPRYVIVIEGAPPDPLRYPLRRPLRRPETPFWGAPGGG